MSKVIGASAHIESIVVVLTATCPKCASEVVHAEEVVIQHQKVPRAALVVETTCQECESPVNMGATTSWEFR